MLGLRKLLYIVWSLVTAGRALPAVVMRGFQSHSDDWKYFDLPGTVSISSSLRLAMLAAPELSPIPVRELSLIAVAAEATHAGELGFPS